MIKIGITGQAGFVGTHLFNFLGLQNEIERISFDDSCFLDESKLRNFVRQCDVIVHLAAMNRHNDPDVLYKTNIKLVEDLIAAMEVEHVSPHVIFSSSTQEERDNLYGRSKKEVWRQANDSIEIVLFFDEIAANDTLGCPAEQNAMWHNDSKRAIVV